MTDNENQEQIQETITNFMLAEYQIIANNRAHEIERGQSYVNLFLTIASGTAALLALMSQVASTAFSFISIPILLILFLLGIISYIRVVQRDIRITTHSRHMGRIRHFFVEIQPGIQKYLPNSPHDDRSYLHKGSEVIGLKNVVSLINSSVAAIIVFLVINTIAEVRMGTVTAVIIFIMALMLHEWFAKARYRRAENENKEDIQFPSRVN